jgi:hypothetical protein
MIALHDADSASALQFVEARLHNAGIDIQFSREETEKINCLGGRASDLASVRSRFISVIFEDEHAIFTAHTKNACWAETYRRS